MRYPPDMLLEIRAARVALHQAADKWRDDRLKHHAPRTRELVDHVEQAREAFKALRQSARTEAFTGEE